MALIRQLFLLIIAVQAIGTSTLLATNTSDGSSTPAAHANAEHALSPAPDILFHIGPLPITNSMITCWAIAILLVIVVRILVRKPRLIPTRPQFVLEQLFEYIINITAPILGPKTARNATPLLISLFIYILIQNWSSLLPGVGSIYYKGEALIRPANADLNTTLALALISTAAWLFLILKNAGPLFVIKDIFGNKADKSSIPAIVYYLLFPIFLAVGFIELISIVFRPVSLSFRLFGNVFGGENLIHSMSSIFWALPIPFYFLELLIGLIQALVFTLLTAVYIGLITKHAEEHATAHH